jgi:hypothetical protein
MPDGWDPVAVLFGKNADATQAMANAELQLCVIAQRVRWLNKADGMPAPRNAPRNAQLTDTRWREHQARWWWRKLGLLVVLSAVLLVLSAVLMQPSLAAAALPEQRLCPVCGPCAPTPTTHPPPQDQAAADKERAAAELAALVNELDLREAKGRLVELEALKDVDNVRALALDARERPCRPRLEAHYV